MEASTVTDVLVVIVVALGGLAWRSLKSGVDRAANLQAEELMAERTKSARLERELEQVRGTERQELRFTSYGLLWAKMRPLAIYDDSPIDRETMAVMSKELSGWYFSANGGLMLTTHNRDLYFALQDLVTVVAQTKENWKAERTLEAKTVFDEVVRRRHLTAAQRMIGYLDNAKPEDWPSAKLEEMVEGWRNDVAELAKAWAELGNTERFAVLQQVSSVLRTGLAKDVESRLR